MPAVSVIIAAWNAQDFVRAAIDSALAQDLDDLEVIVVDDASTDKTASLVEAIEDSRVRCLKLAQNGGAAAARNAGISAATGEWLAVLDADDAFEPGRLGRLVAAAKETNADIIADNFWIDDASSQASRRLFIPEALDDGHEVYELAGYAMANRLFDSVRPPGYLKPLFSRAFLHAHALSYDTTLRIGEDYQLVAEAMALGARFVRHRSAGYIYTTREGSISHRLQASQVEAMALADVAFLKRYRSQLSSAAATAVKAHLSSLRDGYGFVSLVEALKSRSLGGVVSICLQRPQALRHLAMPLKVRLDRWAAKIGLGAAPAEGRRSMGTA